MKYDLQMVQAWSSNRVILGAGLDGEGPGKGAGK